MPNTTRRRNDVKFGLALPSMIPGLDRDTIFEWCRRIDAGPYSSLACGERITSRDAMKISMSLKTVFLL